MSGNCKFPRNPRNVIFFGETGTGKSSAINLLLEAGAIAPVSNDSQPCTRVSAYFETMVHSTPYKLWDTRGLGEGSNFLRTFLRGGSEKELKKFLGERHHKREIDLLVYCVRGSRATQASLRYYDTFCAITHRLAAPVVIVVTQLEKEKEMEDWWKRSSSSLKELKMEFDDHACITTLPGHPRAPESKKMLVDLITRNYHWEAKCSGSYFGSPVHQSIPSPPSGKGGITSLLKTVLGWKDKGNFDVERLDHHPSNRPRPFSPASSRRDSSYHTAESPRESVPPSPVVEPPTPRSESISTKLPHISTKFLGIGNQSQPPSEETSSVGSSSHSMFYASSHSSYTSKSEVHLQTCTEENEDCLSELPFKHSTATVRRRRGYATRCGSFGDIWECDLIIGETCCVVAVKAVKTDTNRYEGLKAHEKKLRRELKIWERLRHRNIVPLLGVVSGFGPLASMMLKLSEKHGLLSDIAAGLCYLHSQDIVHGDLHSDNVLIDDHGTACLTDFGLSLVHEFVGTSYLKSSVCGAVLFADPALVQRVNSSQDNVFYPTTSCDIYSFGGLMLHVLSGRKPYDGFHLAASFTLVLKGERPQIPTQDKRITPWHKSVIRRCWDHEEGRRPSANDIARMFNRQ